MVFKKLVGLVEIIRVNENKGEVTITNSNKNNQIKSTVSFEMRESVDFFSDVSNLKSDFKKINYYNKNFIHKIFKKQNKEKLLERILSIGEKSSWIILPDEFYKLFLVDIKSSKLNQLNVINLPVDHIIIGDYSSISILTNGNGYFILQNKKVKKIKVF